MYALWMLPLGVGSRTENALRICLVHSISQAGTAAHVGASQPQVSRILKGEYVLVSRLFEKVYLFGEQFDAGATLETVRANKDLMKRYGSPGMDLQRMPKRSLQCSFHGFAQARENPFSAL